MTIVTDPMTGLAAVKALMARMTGDEKHTGAASSTLETLWVLYDRVLRVDPAWAEDRDRFFLSKGHGPMAYYAVLAAKGFFPLEELDGFGRFRSRLGLHPDRHLVPGVEISSGSLGHGLPLAVGTALGLRIRGLTEASVWVLIGDAELDEGSNHEAIAFAGRAGLERLNVVVIDNASASHGWPGGIEARFTLEGWTAVRTDGRDPAALEAAFAADRPGQPRVVVAQVEQHLPTH
ncbi:transketolase [Kineosporia sp. NBRC 101731]|uniref:transketolase n=1 Tax=Kineosporia sp. NBRC 101731 TaxID=3032199 RepID=UPI0024A1FA1F|nr:transketolase [Kineosporia sp. NBRC 101731]GLY33860.1 transketolase [Kineosporia sp. NBRC 101731]